MIGGSIAETVGEGQTLLLADAQHGSPQGDKSAARIKALWIERHVLGRSGYRGARGFDRNQRRVSEVTKLIKHRHGGGACDTDDGEMYLRPLIPHFMALAKRHNAPSFYELAMGFCQTLLPILARAEAPTILEEAEQDPRGFRFLKADAIATALHVTYAERTALGLRTIGAVDRTKRQRTADRKKRDAEFQRQKRARNGATPRAQSKAATEPWKDHGCSRSTYFDRLKKGIIVPTSEPNRTISSAVVRSTYTLGTDQSGQQEQTALGPARKAIPSRSVGAGGHSPRSIPKGVQIIRPLPPPLPGGGCPGHLDLSGRGQHLGDVAWEVVQAYTGGIMSPEVIRAVQAAQQARMLREEDVAHQIGVSPPQLSEALRQRFGLSRAAAGNLRVWLAAA